MISGARGVVVRRGRRRCWGDELRLDRDLLGRGDLDGLRRLEHGDHVAARVLPAHHAGEGHSEVALGRPHLDLDATLLDHFGERVSHHGDGPAGSVAVEGWVEHGPEPFPRRPVPVAARRTAARELLHGERRGGDAPASCLGEVGREAVPERRHGTFVGCRVGLALAARIGAFPRSGLRRALVQKMAQPRGELVGRAADGRAVAGHFAVVQRVVVRAMIHTGLRRVICLWRMLRGELTGVKGCRCRIFL